MGRGPGTVQRGLLAAVATWAEHEIAAGHHAPSWWWMTIRDASTVIYGTDQPTPPQREAIRRAVHQLAAKGQLEIGSFGDVAGTRQRKLYYRIGAVVSCRGEGCRYCQNLKAAPRFEGVNERYVALFPDSRSWAEVYAALGEPWHGLVTQWTDTQEINTGARFLKMRRPLTETERAYEEKIHSQMVAEVKALLSGSRQDDLT